MMGKKRKVLSSLVFGLMLCVPAVGVHAAEYISTITEDTQLKDGDRITVENIGIGGNSSKGLNIGVQGDVLITARNENSDVTGISASYHSLYISKEKNAKLSIDAQGGEKAVGIYIITSGNDNAVIDPDLDIKAGNHLISNSSYDGTYGIYVGSYSSEDVIFNGNIDIEVNSDSENDISAIMSSGTYEKLIFNGNVKAVVSAEDQDWDLSQLGISAVVNTSYGGETVFNKNVDLISNVSSTDEDMTIAGVSSFYSPSKDEENIITFNGKTNITVNNQSGKAVGVFCRGAGDPFDNNSNAFVNFRNDVFIGTQGEENNFTAILVQDDGIVDISKTEESNTSEDAVHGIINGNIQFVPEQDLENKGLVNLNFTGSDSLINGDIFFANDNNSATINLALHDGAVWRPTGLNGGSSLTNLLLDDGVIEQNNPEKIDIRNYSGTGNIFFTAKDEDKEGVLDLSGTGDVKIEKAEKDSFIQVGAANQTVNTLDIRKTEESLNALAGKVQYKAGDGQLGGEVILAEGLITPEARADLVFDTDGKGYAANITGGDRAVTQTMQAMRGIAAVNIVSWRQEDSTLSQRLGDLRENTGGQGIWARVSRGEFEYSGAFKNQYNYFQIGWDMAKDDWHYGAAVSYNDGETTYANGNGENSSTSLSLYGTRLLNDGQYFDIVLKAGRLTNKYDNYAAAGYTHGDYDAWGTEISGEYGKKIDLSNDWFVTPQAQLSLMRIGSEDYTTSNGIHVDQDTLYSAVGRIGAEVGKKTAWGSLYAKASVLHDFAGDADTYLTYQGLSNSYSQDIGDTWYEAGFGANWKMSDSSYLYVDVIRTFGGDIKTPWQWNAGVRWGF